MGLEATSRESLAVGRLPQSLAARRGAVAVQPIRVSVVLTELWPEIAPARRLYFGPRDFGSSCGSLPAIARNPRFGGLEKRPPVLGSCAPPSANFRARRFHFRLNQCTPICLPRALVNGGSASPNYAIARGLFGGVALRFAWARFCLTRWACSNSTARPCSISRRPVPRTDSGTMGCRLLTSPRNLWSLINVVAYRAMVSSSCSELAARQKSLSVSKSWYVGV